jgi:MFS family permease
MADRRIVPGARQPIFYGWWIVLAALVLNLFQAGAFTYGFSLFVDPLSRSFGWSKSALSAVYSGTLIVSLLLGPLVGALIDRYGGRALVWAGVPTFGLAYILMPELHGYPLFFAVSVILLGFGLAAGIQAPGEAEIAYWFRRRRAFAMGLATSGAGVSGLTLVPGLGWVIAHRSWQDAALALGALMILAAYPIGRTLKGRPEDHGQQVDGVGTGTSSVSSDHAGRPEPTFTPREAWSTPAFWLLNLAFGFGWLGATMVAVHQVPYLIKSGFSAQAAAVALGASLAISAPSRLAFGWFGDRTNIRLWLILSYALQGSSLLVLMSASGVWMLGLYALLFGLGSAALPLSSALVAEYFGRRSFATIQGSGRPFSQIGRVLGAMTGGIIYDVTGSYHAAFLTTAGAFLISVVLLVVARPPSSRQPERPDGPDPSRAAHRHAA